MQKKHKPEPITKARIQPVDEMADALCGMVTAAETNGGRDSPEVVAAREVLAKHEKTQ
jgi:hypothetical protein